MRQDISLITVARAFAEDSTCSDSDACMLGLEWKLAAVDKT